MDGGSGLQLAIQILLDIGNHILVSKGKTDIESYTDIIVNLGRDNIIPQKFAESIKGMAGFRNILIHQYTDLDIKIVRNILNKRLRDFEEFSKYIREYIAGN